MVCTQHYLRQQGAGMAEVLNGNPSWNLELAYLPENGPDIEGLRLIGIDGNRDRRIRLAVGSVKSEGSRLRKGLVADETISQKSKSAVPAMGA